jgi:hypothetical protein
VRRPPARMTGGEASRQDPISTLPTTGRRSAGSGQHPEGRRETHQRGRVLPSVENKAVEGAQHSDENHHRHERGKAKAAVDCLQSPRAYQGASMCDVDLGVADLEAQKQRSICLGQGLDTRVDGAVH